MWGRVYNQSCAAKHTLLRAGLPIIVSLLSCGQGWQALARPVGHFDEGDFFSDIPHITSATRIPQNLAETPVSSTLITQEMIQAMGAEDIPELLRLAPGFQVYRPNANKAAVTYHGGSGDFPRDLEVRVNGRPVYIPLLSTVAWNTLGISIHDVQQIEVIRGSNVPSYGSNALMGAINIITRSPVAPASRQLQGRFGAQRTRNGAFAINNSDNSLFYRVSLAREENDGFDFQHDGERVTKGNLHLTYTPTLYDSFELMLGLNHGQMVSGQGKDLRDYEKRSHHAHFGQLNWQHTGNNGHELNLQLYHNYLRLRTPGYLFSQLAGDPGLLHTNRLLSMLAIHLGDAYPFSGTQASDFLVTPLAEFGTTHTYGAELHYLLQPTRSLTLASGLGLRLERATSLPLLGHNNAIDEETYFLFGNAQWRAHPALTWNLGAMTELTSKTRSTTSTRLGLSHHLSERASVRAAVTRAYRAPSLLEKNAASSIVSPEGIPFDFLTSRANDQLDPERLSAWEIGAFWQLPDSAYLDIKLFHEHIRNGIGERFYRSDYDIISVVQALEQNANALQDFATDRFPLDEARERWNGNHVTTKGIELQASLHPTPATLIHLAYAYNQIKGIERRGDLPEKPDKRFDHTSPRHTASLLVQHALTPSLTGTLMLNYLSTVRWQQSSLYADQKTIDLLLRHRHPVSSTQTLTLGVHIKNLLDERYSEFQVRNRYGRRLYVTLAMDF